MAKILIRICFLLLIAILVIACGNYFIINNKVCSIDEESLSIIQQIDSIISSPNKCGYNETITLINNQKDHILNLNKLMKGVFDSNTLTFMVSFVLIFLGGILLDIEHRTNNHIEKARLIQKNLYIEISSIKLENIFNTISMIAKYLNILFIENKYKISAKTNMLTHEINTNAKEILDLLGNKDCKYITKSALDSSITIINKVIGILSNEEILDNNTLINESIQSLKKIKIMLFKLETLQDDIIK